MSANLVDRRAFFKNAVTMGATLAGCAGMAGMLSGGRSSSAAPLRPPGAVPEAEFAARCIRCLRCVEACPNNAIIALDDAFGGKIRNTPAIKARRQACMLCNRIEGEYLKCTQACPSGALQPIRKDIEEIRQKVAMGTAEIDLALCYSYNNWSCGACYRACPLPGRAMTLGLWERPEVHAEACIGCGLCERSCIRYPQAIRIRPRDEQRTENREERRATGESRSSLFSLHASLPANGGEGR